VLPDSSESSAMCVLSRNTGIAYAYLQCYLRFVWVRNLVSHIKGQAYIMFKHRDVTENGRAGGTSLLA
jgi:hypothetical protein